VLASRPFSPFHLIWRTRPHLNTAHIEQEYDLPVNLLENRPVRLVVGVFLIGMGLLALVTGKAMDTTPPAASRHRHDNRPMRWTSRAEDPVLFYMEVLVMLGGGGFLVYKSRERE